MKRDIKSSHMNNFISLNKYTCGWGEGSVDKVLAI